MWIFYKEDVLSALVANVCLAGWVCVVAYVSVCMLCVVDFSFHVYGSHVVPPTSHMGLCFARFAGLSHVDHEECS